MIANVGMHDRIVRVALGLALIGAAILGWTGPWGWAGLLPLLTGIYGVCPLYMPFRFNTFKVYAREKDVFEEQRIWH